MKSIDFLKVFFNDFKNICNLEEISRVFLIERVRSSPPEVFLGKGVPKIRNRFTREHPCLSWISVKGFSEHLFI